MLRESDSPELSEGERPNLASADENPMVLFTMLKAMQWLERKMEPSWNTTGELLSLFRAR